MMRADNSRGHFTAPTRATEGRHEVVAESAQATTVAANPVQRRPGHPLTSCPPNTMDLFDLPAAQPDRRLRPLPPVDPAESWRALLAQAGADIALPLTRAIERLHEVAAGPLDRQVLRALRDDLEAARMTGLVAQQLAHVGDTRLRQSRERLPLAQALKNAVVRRLRGSRTCAVQLQQVMRPVEVVADASLLGGLLNATLEWAVGQSASAVEFRIETRPAPAAARLSCRFARRRTSAGAGSDEERRAQDRSDSLRWKLIEQLCSVMDVTVERHDDDDTGHAVLWLDFHAVPNSGSALEDFNAGFAPASHPKPLAGNQVLVIAASADLRDEIVASLRDMGLLIDIVHTVDEAAAFCREGLPHAVIYEAGLADLAFAELHRGIRSEVAEIAFIEVAGDGDTLEMSPFDAPGVARIGRDAVAGSLPSALMFELTKSY